MKKIQYMSKRKCFVFKDIKNLILFSLYKKIDNKIEVIKQFLRSERFFFFFVEVMLKNNMSDILCTALWSSTLFSG